jgi:hypothetical protein
MSKVALSGNASGTGVITVTSPNTNSNFTQTLPTRTGTVTLDGPAFSAQADGTQTVTSSSYQKVLFPTEAFDTDNNFASSRFTPTVAGYYQCNAVVGFSGGAGSETVIAAYKNGSLLRYLADITPTNFYSLSGSFLVSMNGSTDYLEIYVFQSTGVTKTVPSYSWFDGFLARAA